jgi:hypothetical protein
MNNGRCNIDVLDCVEVNGAMDEESMWLTGSTYFPAPSSYCNQPSSNNGWALKF